MTSDQPLPLLLQDGDSETGSLQGDPGYGDQHPADTSLGASDQSIRPRTPRELLRKVPRRISLSSAKGSSDQADQASVGSGSINHQPKEDVPDRLVDAPTCTRTTVSASSSPVLPSPRKEEGPVPMQAFAPNDTAGLAKPTPRRTLIPTASSSPVQPSPQKDEGPVPMQAFVPNCTAGLAKPTPTRRASISLGSIQKPNDPAMEMEARKALLQQSRRRHSGESADQQLALQPPAKKHCSSAFDGSTSLPPLRYSNAPNNDSTGADCVPLVGWREGCPVVTGIVVRRDGMDKKSGKKANIAIPYKLDDPNGPYDGPGHVMHPVELYTEAACYEGLKIATPWKIKPVPAVDYTTGLPLPPSPDTLFFPPTHRSGSSPGAPERHLEQPPPLSIDTLASPPTGPSRRVSLEQPNNLGSFSSPSPPIFSFPITTCSLLGLTDLRGNEEHFNHIIKLFDLRHPYARFPSSCSGRPTPSVQGVRAGDFVTTVVSIKYPGVPPTHEAMDVYVLSVTSFGHVNGIPSTSCLSNASEEIISFPSTCVLGVRFGDN